MAASPVPDKEIPPPADAVVVGGGPAGLRAAEVLAASGARVALYDQKRSVGRKFLVAGRGGLNLTHSEELTPFVTRYGSELPRWREMLAAFGPAELRAWAADLGVETYVGTSGRVFPVGQQAAGLLRRWISRLRASGVTFHVCHRLEAIVANGQPSLRFRDLLSGEGHTAQARAIVLALGGASWPETGSDGTWPTLFKGLTVAPWQPANCGWEVDWDPRVLTVADGLPLKNVAAAAGGQPVRGEMIITRYGLEGGILYQLGPQLRATLCPQLEIDLKPDTTEDRLRARLGSTPQGWADVAQRLKLSPAARALLEWHGTADPRDARTVAASVKRLPLALRGPRPVAEAISSAGGVRWPDVDETLMLRTVPGVFVAGEMIDWEAPTGGYLLQGCFATGTFAGNAAARWLGTSEPC